MRISCRASRTLPVPLLLTCTRFTSNAQNRRDLSTIRMMGTSFCGEPGSLRPCSLRHEMTALHTGTTSEHLKTK
ncbi:hypothetical protein L226DRAFT_201388 [Lentinus tigrinus ALCF2SS1-7]|uniref:uncharacterized protein n=1 Tax=Lentinus tigrinus ALCF2SS1-7 TaxID=1328758 RepID=UPI0011660E3B|nr:hypothetical protein L226DRAFT_201388 [Lentinus tigrinus ALCF2SS1-7]